MLILLYVFVFFFKQKTAYEMRISDWSSDVCSSDLFRHGCSSGSGGAAADAALAVDEGRAGLDHVVGVDGDDGVNRGDGGEVADPAAHHRRDLPQIGREACRERVCQYV